MVPDLLVWTVAALHTGGMRWIPLIFGLLLTACLTIQKPVEHEIPDGFTAVRVGFLANGAPAGIGFVLEQGRLFEGQRIVAIYQRFGSAEGLQQSLADRSIDIAVGLPTYNAAAMLGDNVPVVIAAGLMPPDERVVVPISSTIQSTADLVGKRVGLSAGPTDLMFHAMVTGTQSVLLSETQLVQQLSIGVIDAAVLRQLTVAGLPDAARYRVVGDISSMWQTASGQSVPPSVSTVTMRRELAEDSDLAARTLASVLTAVRWGGEHEREVRTLMATHLKMTQTNAGNYAKAWSSLYAARLDDRSIAAMNMLIDQYRIEGPIKPIPSNSFAPTLFRNAQQISR